jgi:phospholipid/cholesterol/gamma-HCH transport system substrate-binding protein
MPERGRVRWSQLKVGIVGIAAFVVVTTLVVLLTTSRGLFQDQAHIRTYMDDASGIVEGTPVRLNGITIGFLENFRLTNARDRKRTVEFNMAIRPRYLSDISADSVAGIGAANLLGDKFINITKGASPERVKDGGELASLQAQDIPELMAASANFLASFQNIVKRLDALIAGVEAGKGNLGKFVKDEELYDRLNGVAAETQKLLADARTGGGTIGKLIYDDSLYQEIRQPINRINAILADLQAGQGTAGKLLKDPSLFDDARQTVSEIRSLLADLNAGKGTAGRLLKDEELHQRINELTAKLNSTLDKINSGQGTLGQLMTNPALYDSLTNVTKETQSLMKDFRANPKKFLTIKLTLF